MALVTVHRSPTSGSNSLADSSSSAENGDVTADRMEGDESRLRSPQRSRVFSESYLTVKGAALILSQSECLRTVTVGASHGGDMHQHLQAMFYLLRPEDTLKMTVKLESPPHLLATCPGLNRYMVLVSTYGRQDTEESVILGIDIRSIPDTSSSSSLITVEPPEILGPDALTVPPEISGEDPGVEPEVQVVTGDDVPTDVKDLNKSESVVKTALSATIGLVLPVWSGLDIHLDGDGGFSVTLNGQHLIFKPVSVQALWSALQCLIKARDCANSNRYYADGLTHTWVSYYTTRVTSDQACINEWYTMDGIESHRDEYNYSADTKEGAQFEQIIRRRLKDIMMTVDLEDVTSKYLRERLEQELKCSLAEYKHFVDTEMIVILRQMDAPSKIFDYLYLGSEWNASNLEELKRNNVGYILNVTREIDNFFPGVFQYLNIRVYDLEESELLKHWDNTYKFIAKARNNKSHVLVHCKMGVSRSASTVIAYVMKVLGCSLDEAYQHVKQRRSCIKPNDGFMAQLGTYQGILDASKQRHNKLWRSMSVGNLQSSSSSSSTSSSLSPSSATCTLISPCSSSTPAPQGKYPSPQQGNPIDIGSTTVTVAAGGEIDVEMPGHSGQGKSMSWSSENNMNLILRKTSYTTDTGCSPSPPAGSDEDSSPARPAHTSPLHLKTSSRHSRPSHRSFPPPSSSSTSGISPPSDHMFTIGDLEDEEHEEDENEDVSEGSGSSYSSSLEEFEDWKFCHLVPSWALGFPTGRRDDRGRDGEGEDGGSKIALLSFTERGFDEESFMYREHAEHERVSRRNEDDYEAKEKISAALVESSSSMDCVHSHRCGSYDIDMLAGFYDTTVTGGAVGRGCAGRGGAMGLEGGCMGSGEEIWEMSDDDYPSVAPLNPFLHPDVKLEFALSRHKRQCRAARLLAMDEMHHKCPSHDTNSHRTHGTSYDAKSPAKKRRRTTSRSSDATSQGSDVMNAATAAANVAQQITKVRPDDFWIKDIPLSPVTDVLLNVPPPLVLYETAATAASLMLNDLPLAAGCPIVSVQRIRSSLELSSLCEPANGNEGAGSPMTAADILSGMSPCRHSPDDALLYDKEEIPWSAGTVRRQTLDLEGRFSGGQGGAGGLTPGDEGGRVPLSASPLSFVAREGDTVGLAEFTEEAGVSGRGGLGGVGIVSMDSSPKTASSLMRPTSVYEVEDISLEPGIVLKTKHEIEERERVCGCISTITTDPFLTPSPTTDTKPLSIHSSFHEKDHSPFLSRRATGLPSHDRTSERRKSCIPALHGDHTLQLPSTTPSGESGSRAVSPSVSSLVRVELEGSRDMSYDDSHARRSYDLLGADLARSDRTGDSELCILSENTSVINARCGEGVLAAKHDMHNDSENLNVSSYVSTKQLSSASVALSVNRLSTAPIVSQSSQMAFAQSLLGNLGDICTMAVDKIDTIQSAVLLTDFSRASDAVPFFPSHRVDKINTRDNTICDNIVQNDSSSLSAAITIPLLHHLHDTNTSSADCIKSDSVLESHTFSNAVVCASSVVLRDSGFIDSTQFSAGFLGNSSPTVIKDPISRPIGMFEGDTWPFGRSLSFKDGSSVTQRGQDAMVIGTLTPFNRSRSLRIDKSADILRRVTFGTLPSVSQDTVASSDDVNPKHSDRDIVGPPIDEQRLKSLIGLFEVPPVTPSPSLVQRTGSNTSGKSVCSVRKETALKDVSESTADEFNTESSSVAHKITTTSATVSFDRGSAMSGNDIKVANSTFFVSVAPISHQSSPTQLMSPKQQAKVEPAAKAISAASSLVPRTLLKSFQKMLVSDSGGKPAVVKVQQFESAVSMSKVATSVSSPPRKDSVKLRDVSVKKSTTAVWYDTDSDDTVKGIRDPVRLTEKSNRSADAANVSSSTLAQSVLTNIPASTVDSRMEKKASISVSRSVSVASVISTTAQNGNKVADRCNTTLTPDDSNRTSLSHFLPTMARSTIEQVNSITPAIAKLEPTNFPHDSRDVSESSILVEVTTSGVSTGLTVPARRTTFTTGEFCGKAGSKRYSTFPPPEVVATQGRISIKKRLSLFEIQDPAARKPAASAAATSASAAKGRAVTTAALSTATATITAAPANATATTAQTSMVTTKDTIPVTQVRAKFEIGGAASGRQRAESIQDVNLSRKDTPETAIENDCDSIVLRNCESAFRVLRQASTGSVSIGPVGHPASANSSESGLLRAKKLHGRTHPLAHLSGEYRGTSAGVVWASTNFTAAGLDPVQQPHAT